MQTPVLGAALSGEYSSLQKYLTVRYADLVVLTFSEIEDLLGFALPALARLQQDWWAPAPPDASPAAPAQSWTRARRTATANLGAQTVRFERISV